MKTTSSEAKYSKTRTPEYASVPHSTALDGFSDQLNVQ